MSFGVSMNEVVSITGGSAGRIACLPEGAGTGSSSDCAAGKGAVCIPGTATVGGTSGVVARTGEVDAASRAGTSFRTSGSRCHGTSGPTDAGSRAVLAPATVACGPGIADAVEAERGWAMVSSPCWTAITDVAIIVWTDDGAERDGERSAIGSSSRRREPSRRSSRVGVSKRRRCRSPKDMIEVSAPRSSTLTTD